MLFWHMGVAAVIVYVTLGRRRIDYRYILIGAVLPDIVDAVLTTSAFESASGRGPAHSLTAVIVIAVAIMLGLRGDLRQAVFGIAVGWLLHLVGDVMWEAPRTFLWPAFGSGFEPTPAEPYSWSLFTDPASHLGPWLGELAGLAVLAWFWVAFRLGEEGRARLFLSDGYLRP
jgi:inner membrane protein